MEREYDKTQFPSGGPDGSFARKSHTRNEKISNYGIGEPIRPQNVQENDAILAALSADIQDLKKASLALRNEVQEDLSIIGSVMSLFNSSNTQLQSVVERVGGLSRINTYKPFFLLFFVIFAMLVVLYVVSMIKRWVSPS